MRNGNVSHPRALSGSFSGHGVFGELDALQLSVPNSLGPANFELGIIAGTRSINLILSTMLPNPDDGKVSVESARLDEMKAFLVVEAGHTFMMRNNLVIAQILSFLRDGEFKPLPPSPDSSGYENR